MILKIVVRLDTLNSEFKVIRIVLKIGIKFKTLNRVLSEKMLDLKHRI